MSVVIQKMKDYSETKIIAVVTTLAIIFTAIVFFLMRPIEQELTTQSVYGVIDLEFAWNVLQMEQILASWGDDLIAMEINAVLLDFGFLIVYSLSLAGITLLITQSGILRSWTNLGYYFTVIPFIAAAFDVIENINLLLILSSPSSFPTFAPFVASVCASFKFGLIIATALFWLLGVSSYVIRR
ncbi:MAG: hypothetical protein ACXABU_05530 [Candidatus Hodarchaeales archaeon]|jgi:hypothetical protein